MNQFTLNYEKREKISNSINNEPEQNVNDNQQMSTLSLHIETL